MSTGTSLNRAQVNGAGAATPIAFNRKVFAATDIVGEEEIVATGVVRDLVQGTDFSVTGAGNTSTGVTITPLIVIPSGNRWTFWSEQANTQNSVYTENDRFPAKTTEYALDKVTIGVQDNERVGELALRYPDTEEIGTNTQLPTKSVRANTALTFDANGEPSFSPVGSSATSAVRLAESVATAGQTVIATPSHTTGINNVSIYINGAKLLATDFVDSTSTTVTLDEPLFLGDTIRVEVNEVQDVLSSVAAGSVSFTQTGTGAVATNLQARNEERVSVKDFGATGDGTTDDSVAIQLAIDAANYGERSLRIPAGEYYIGTTSLVINGPIRIYGEGMGQAYADSFGALCTTIRYVGSDAAVKINTGISKSTLGFVLENISISGYATGTATATGSYGIRCGADTGSNLAAQGQMRNVRCEGFTVANLHYINAQGIECYDCRCQFGTGSGLLIEGGATSGGGNRSNGFTHCLFKQNKIGVSLHEGGNIRFSLCHFEQNDEEGVHIQRQASSGSYSFNDFYFDRCHIENNQDDPNTGSAWATSTAYVRGDFVNESSLLYKCVTAHTSGTFATDLAAGDWILVKYAAQFLIDTSLNTSTGGARVFIDGGRWIAQGTEANGIRSNRLWVCNHGTLVKTHARPNLFSYPEGAVEPSEDNQSAVIRVVDNFDPWTTAATPTAGNKRPITGASVEDFWSMPYGGADTGVGNASVLTDSGQSWTTDELVGYTVRNITDGSEGLITANTATVVTATLSGGTDDDWDVDDSYVIITSGGAMTYEHENIGTGDRYWGTNEDVYLVNSSNASNIFRGGFSSYTDAAAVGFSIDGDGKILNNQMSANTNTPSGATAYEMPLYNVNGTLLGYVPIYGSQW